jgi:hypothetical protein
VKVLRSKRRILGIICRKFRQASSEHPAHQRPKSGGTAAGECTLAYQVKGWSGSMRYVLSLMLAVSALGIMPASSEETELGVSLASLDNAITVGSNGNDRPDDGRNMALIKEGEFESPEMIAVIERNREDRERTVVIDR